MAQAEHKDTLNVSKDKLFAAITRYEDYPKFVDGCQSVKVERKGAGQARVTYHISMMKDVSYTLDHVEDAAAGEVRWTLVKSGDMKKNNGSWRLRDLGGGKTQVEYEIDIELAFPVPGFILKKLVGNSLPAMVKGFEKQALKA